MTAPHSTSDAVQFLQGWAETGPWVLTSIVPDGGGITTATFGPASIPQMRGWIEARQGVQNLYFTVNRTFRAMTVKPKKLHIAAAHALHVDVDPRAGEPLEPERERIRRMVEDWERDGKKLPFPRPTVTIDSGGGYQLFWLLDGGGDLPGEPEDETRHLPVEDRNRAIGAAMGGDNTQNIDRIMRLPGTVNVPDAKKRLKGRTARLASVVEVDWTRLYSLDAFPRAPEVVASAPAPAAGGRVASAGVSPGPVRRIASLDELGVGVDDHTKAMIVQGMDPNDPEKWADRRSELVLHVNCALIRADVSEADMVALMLDPDYKFGAHVQEQPKPLPYAWRQVDRALEKQPRPGPIVAPSPLNLARAFRGARRPHLMHHQQEFLEWDGAAYVGIADDTARADVWRFLETCRVETTDKDGAKRVKPLVPIPETVSATLDALRAVTHLPSPAATPALRWLDGRAGPDPLDLLSTRSGLLHLPSGDLLPATPQLFTRNALDFAHDAAAPAPVLWLKFLKDVWPDDDEADCITALQEFMGYLLTPDTRLQKALMFDGPKRSGKGTIGRVMRRLVGEANTTAPSMNSLGGGQFGLEPLLAKQLAVISDMRLSNKTDEAALAENLLRITGEDPVSVNRKNKLALEVVLGVRFVVMTNEVPKFADRSGALVGRFIVLPMRQSFFGREDPGLTGKLMAELPGILNWAVEGWQRVRATGRIKQPEGGSEVAEQMVNLSSPHPRFIERCCVLHKDHIVDKEALFRAFRAWFQNDVGQPYRHPESVFSRDLYSATDKAVKATRVREGDDRRHFYKGISLRDGVMAELVQPQHEPPF